MTDLALRPRSATEIIDLAVRLLRRHFGTFFTVALVGLVPSLLVQLAIGGVVANDPALAVTRVGRLTLLALPVGLVFGALLISALLVCGDEALRTGAPDVGLAYRRAASRLLVVIGVNLLSSIAILIGFALLFVPGVYVALRLATAVPAAVIEGDGVLNSLRRAWARADGYVGHSFKTLLLVGLIYLAFLLATLVVGTIAAAMAGGLTRGITGGNAFAVRAGTQLVMTLASAAVYPLLTNALLLLAYDLRVRREGYDVEAMVTSLGSAA